MNNDLISRSALLEWLCEGCNGAKKVGCGAPCCDYDLIQQAPAVDAVSPGVVEQFKWERDTALAQLAELGIGLGEKMPEIQVVRHGRWVQGMQCSECGQVDLAKPNYCPDCGAKMDGELK